MIGSYFGRCCGAVISSFFSFCILALMLPALAGASPESLELVKSGSQALEKKDYKGALRQFQEAAKADPADWQAVFFEGVAMNRLGAHAPALNALQAAQKNGFTHPEMDFESGWALLGIKRFADAAAALEKFEKSSPGRGQTSEFLGRAYLGLKQYDKADAALRAAVKRDPRLKGTVELALAALDQARGQKQAAATHLQSIVSESPESPLGRALRGMVPPSQPQAQPQAQAEQVEKLYSLSFSVAEGYNDNVIALGDTLPVPSDITGKGSAFTEINFGASMSHRFNAQTLLTAGYALLADVYSALPKQDMTDHFFYADMNYTGSEKLTLTLRAAGEVTSIGGKAFRDRPSLRPALDWRWDENAVTEFAPEFSWSNYKMPAGIPAQNRIGDAESVAFTHYQTFRQLAVPVQARLGYAHTWNNTVGADFQSHSDLVTVGANAPLFFGVTGDVNYSHTFDRYNNANSLAGAAGFAFARRDDTDAVTLRLSRVFETRPVFLGYPVTFTVFGQYSSTHEQSNIVFYTFSQNIGLAGLSAQF